MILKRVKAQSVLSRNCYRVSESRPWPVSRENNQKSKGRAPSSLAVLQMALFQSQILVTSCNFCPVSQSNMIPLKWDVYLQYFKINFKSKVQKIPVQVAQMLWLSTSGHVAIDTSLGPSHRFDTRSSHSCRLKPALEVSTELLGRHIVMQDVRGSESKLPTSLLCL